MTAPMSSNALERATTGMIRIAQWIDDLLCERERAEDEGELPDTLAVIDGQLQEAVAREIEKVDDTAHARRVIQWAAETARAEANRMVERARMFEARVERLDAAIIYVSKRFNRKKWETPDNTLSVRGNGGLQPLEADAALIPEEYQTITVKFPVICWHNIPLAMREHASIVALAPDNERIRQTLRQRIVCPECATSDQRPCPRCGGKGTIPQSIPGAKLLPRGEQVRLS